MHDALQGFIGGRGTRTATLEVNLSQHLAGLKHKPLLQVFLDFRKAYDSLDRDQCLEVLSGVWDGAKPNPPTQVLP